MLREDGAGQGRTGKGLEHEEAAEKHGTEVDQPRVCSWLVPCQAGLSVCRYGGNLKFRLLGMYQ
jgi:hypothetical protein